MLVDAERKAQAKANPLVQAVRADKLIGRNSLTSTDECMDDWEVLDEIEKHGLTTKEEVLKHFYEMEAIYLDHAIDITGTADPQPKELMSEYEIHLAKIRRELEG